jgi:hypothetical protein
MKTIGVYPVAGGLYVSPNAVTVSIDGGYFLLLSKIPYAKDIC